MWSMCPCRIHWVQPPSPRKPHNNRRVNVLYLPFVQRKCEKLNFSSSLSRKKEKGERRWEQYAIDSCKQTQSMRLSWENGRKDGGIQLFVTMKRWFSSRQFDAFVRSFGTFMIRFITHIGLWTIWIFFEPFFFWLMRFSHWSRYSTNLDIQPSIVLRSHSHPFYSVHHVLYEISM